VIKWLESIDFKEHIQLNLRMNLPSEILKNFTPKLSLEFRQASHRLGDRAGHATCYNSPFFYRRRCHGRRICGTAGGGDPLPGSRWPRWWTNFSKEWFWAWIGKGLAAPILICLLLCFSEACRPCRADEGYRASQERGSGAMPGGANPAGGDHRELGIGRR